MEEDTIHVAFAEDHDSVRETITFFLNQFEGISIDVEAEDGQELLKKLETTDRLPDICIIDIHMPRMAGYELQIEIRKRWPEMRTLIFTAFDNQARIIRMIKAGANGYLVKTCKPSEIEEALRSIHNSGYYYSKYASNTVFNLVGKNAITTPEFSDNEIEFIKYSCEDLTYAEIAAKMNKTTASINSYRDRVCGKLNVSSRTGIILYAFHSGLVSVDKNAK